jgi:hypothetical protein
MRYLKGTQNEGLVFQASNKQRTPPFKLTVHVDADWGKDPQDRRSRTGVLWQVNDMPCGGSRAKDLQAQCQAAKLSTLRYSKAQKILCGQRTCVNPITVRVTIRHQSSKTSRVPSRGLVMITSERSDTSTSDIITPPI